MTALLISVAFALAAFVVLWRILRGEAMTVRLPVDLRTHTTPVDLQAFRNLIDPAEDRYLRENLGRRDFRKVERLRRRATVEYLRCTAQNAAALIAFGDSLAASPGSASALAGRQLSDMALQVRAQALLAMAMVRLHMPMEGARALTGRYERLRSTVGDFVAATAPAQASSITASL